MRGYMHSTFASHVQCILEIAEATAFVLMSMEPSTFVGGVAGNLQRRRPKVMFVAYNIVPKEM